MSDLVRLRELVLADPVALDKWPMVVDRIIKSAADARRIKAHHIARNADYAEAVLETLQIWRSDGVDAVDLQQVLRDLGLNQLAGTLLRELEGRSTKGTFFGVGELPFNWVRRCESLSEVQKLLSAPPSPGSVLANIVFIFGMGGVGKTTLARIYAWEYLNLHDGNVLWINAASQESMRTSFTRLAHKLGIPVATDKLTNEELLERVYAKFIGQKSLFVFDNVEEKQDLKKFLPTTSPGEETPAILITSRRSDLIPVKRNGLNLGVFTITEAVHLTTSQLATAPAVDVAELVNRLQRFPLALQQAIAYIKDSFFEDSECIKKYLAEFGESESEMDLLDDERFKDDNDYSFTTLNVWNVTLKRIKGVVNGLAAIQLIRIMSMMEPDKIKVPFLRRMLKKNAESNLKLLHKFCMVSLHLASGQVHRVEIHRLVQRVIRVSMCTEDQITTLKQVVETSNAIFTDESKSKLRRTCVWHGLHIVPFLTKHKELISHTVGFVCRLRIFAMAVAGFARSLALLREIEETYTQIFAEEDERTLNVKWQLADLLSWKEHGNMSEVLHNLEALLTIVKSKLPPHHQLHPLILGSIGRVCIKTARFQRGFDVYDTLFRLPVAVDCEDKVIFSHYNHIDEQRFGEPWDMEYRTRQAARLWKHDERQVVLQLRDSTSRWADLFSWFCHWHRNEVTRQDVLSLLTTSGMEKLINDLSKLEKDGCAATSSPAPLWYDVGEFPCNFIRRTKLLARLHEMITTASGCNTGTPACVQVHGAQGVGKSTLARLYAWQQAEFYAQNIVWVNARCAGSFKASFLGFSRKLALQMPETVSIGELLDRVRDRVRGRKCLFVIDDAEDTICLVEQFLSQTSQPQPQPHVVDCITPRVQVLITCNTPYESISAEMSLHLGPLTLEEAVDFIQRRIKKPRGMDIEMLAKTLRQHPLALRQALAVIVAEGRSKHDEACIRRYVDRFNICEIEVLNDGVLAQSNELTIVQLTTWLMIHRRMMRLREADSNGPSAAAICLANTLAYLAPENISTHFLNRLFRFNIADSGIRVLEKVGAVKSQSRGDRVQLNGFTQYAMRVNVDPEKEEAILLDIMRTVENVLDEVKGKSTASEPGIRLEAALHGLHVFAFLLKRKEIMRLKTTCAFITRLCSFLLTSVSGTDAFAVATRSADVYTNICGRDDEMTVEMRLWTLHVVVTMLADRLSSQPKLLLEKSAEILQSNVPLAKDRLGVSHPLTCDSLATLARIYENLGQLDHSLKIYDQLFLLLEPMQEESRNLKKYRHEKDKILAKLLTKVPLPLEP